MAFDMIIDNTYALSDKKVYMPTRPAIPPNTKRMQYIEIPGRDGTVSMFDGYDDRPFPIDFNIYDGTNVNKKLREVNPIFSNCKTIKFTDDPEIYYKVKEFKISDKERVFDKAYEFSAEVKIEPFDYLVEGSKVITLTSSTTLVNPGTYYSEPTLKIYGSGTINMSIGSYSFQVTNVSGYVQINSALLECYKDTDPLGDKMTGSFPLFVPGSNKITLSATITKVELVPNWRFL